MCSGSKRQTAANAASTVTGTPMAQPVANTAGAGSADRGVNTRKRGKQGGGRGQSAYGSLLRRNEQTP